jgi:hypothetical protein
VRRCALKKAILMMPAAEMYSICCRKVNGRVSEKLIRGRMEITRV